MRPAPVSIAAVLIAVFTLALVMWEQITEAQAGLWMGFAIVMAILALKER